MISYVEERGRAAPGETVAMPYRLSMGTVCGWFRHPSQLLSVVIPGWQGCPQQRAANSVPLTQRPLHLLSPEPRILGLEFRWYPQPSVPVLVSLGPRLLDLVVLWHPWSSDPAQVSPGPRLLAVVAPRYP